jgi:hypothetical protein
MTVQALGRPNFLGAFSTILCVFLFCIPLFSQGSAGRILGTVTDQTGGAIAGATITITDTQRGTSRILTTDQSGDYSAPNLIPSAYSVRAEAKGFKSTEHSGITLEVNQDLRVDLQVQPGEQTEKITVTGDLPLIETTNAELGGTIQSAVVENLPLNGRNFENLLSLRPGVTVYPGGGAFTQSTNGIRAHDNMYLVDGINNNEPWLGESIMNVGLAAGDAGTILPIDAIDEFKTEVNPRAEFGWKPGAVVNVGIKSGTNNVHGTAYAYGRSDAFDARDYFAVAPGVPKPPLALEQFGATIGGPIKKNKLFYFLSYEDQRYTVGNPAHHNEPITDPTSTDPNSLVGACMAAGAGVTALSAQLAGLSTSCVPLSNFPGIFPVNNTSSNSVITSINTQNQIDSGLAKLEYHISEKNMLSGFYFISPGSGLVVDDPPDEIANQWLTIQYARSQSGGVNWTWTPNSQLVNEVRVGYSHYYQVFSSNDVNDNPADYNFNGSTYHIYTGQTDSAYFGLPRIRIKDLPSFQLGASSAQILGPDGVLHLLDHVSVLRGKHAFKFGGEVLYLQNTSNITNGNIKGPLTFSNLESFFGGVPNKASFLSGNLLRHISSSGYAAFLQDDWRVKPRLTVNLGVRYEINTVLKERDNLEGNFDAVQGLVQVGSGLTSPFNGDHHDFSPRLGFAWDVRGNGKTVIRAGGSIIYEQLTNDVFNGVGNLLGLRTVPTGVALFANGAQVPSPGNIMVSTVSYSGTSLSGNSPGDLAFNWANNGPNTPLYNLSPACGDGTVEFPKGSGFFPGPCTILGVNRNLRSPYVSTWTLGIQRAITNDLSLEVAYVGNHGTKLISLNDINQPPVGTGWMTPLTAAEAASGADVGLTPAQVCLGMGGEPLYANCSANSVAEQAARPFNSKFPYLNYIDILANGDKSNYNGLQIALTQRTSHGLSFTAGYTYSHSLDNSSDNFGVLRIPVVSSDDRYASSDFDIRHRFTFAATYALPGRNGFGQMLQGWSLNSVVTIQTGTPWFVQDGTNDFTGTGEVFQPTNTEAEQWDFIGNTADFTTKHGFTDFNGGALSGGTGGVPYFGPSGDPLNPSTSAACNAAARKLDGGAMTGLTQAALSTTGCFAFGNSLLIPPAFGTYGTTGRNLFRDTGLKSWDLSVTKVLKFKEWLTAQFRAEFFNVLNHPTFANPYGGPGGGAVSNDPSVGSGFGCGCITADTGGSNPVLGAGGPRAMQLGLKLIW